MDLYVERQCVDQMKGGDAKQFLLLINANFNGVYKYVARRVSDIAEVEKIVRLTFLDALGQIQNTPTDVSYLIWLYSLAKPRVWSYIAKSSFPEKKGLIARDVKPDKKKDDLAEKANKMIGKLSLEEREILRLKFFEEVTDGDVTTILGIEEGVVGPKIYKVLKRSHFLLFGKSEERQGVYFGELSGFFERVRNMEKIEIPDVFKLSLKTDIANRIEKKNFAIKGKVVEEKVVKEKKPGKKSGKKPVGSDDAAKVFVEAVAEMREEEELKKIKEERKLERREKFYDIIDRWKSILALIPAVLFVWIVIFVIVNVMDFRAKVERGHPTTCGIEVAFDGEFSDAEIRGVNKGVSDRICGHFEVSRLLISRAEEGTVEVEVDVPDWFLEYKFVRKIKEWRIKKYARTFNSDQQSGQV